MLYLIWHIFAIAVSVTFIYLCFKAIGLVRREIGMGAAVFFTIGLFATCNRSNKNVTHNQSNQTTRVATANDTLLNFRPGERITLQKNLIFDIKLYYTYAVNRNTNEVQPMNSMSYIEGIGGSINWLPASVSLEPDSSGKALHYFVSGDIEWKLLNFVILTESKFFEGVIPID